MAKSREIIFIARKPRLSPGLIEVLHSSDQSGKFRRARNVTLCTETKNLTF